MLRTGKVDNVGMLGSTKIKKRATHGAGEMFGALPRRGLVNRAVRAIDRVGEL